MSVHILPYLADRLIKETPAVLAGKPFEVVIENYLVEKSSQGYFAIITNDGNPDMLFVCELTDGADFIKSTGYPVRNGSIDKDFHMKPVFFSIKQYASTYSLSSQTVETNDRGLAPLVEFMISTHEYIRSHYEKTML